MYNAMAYNIRFYCRKSKVQGSGLAPIEASLIVNGERSVITLPRKENPDTFEKQTRCRKRTDIKDYLDAVTANIGRYITEIEQSGRGNTLAELKEAVKYGGVRKRTLKDVEDEFMQIQKKRVGVKCGEQQFRKYELAFERLNGYVGERFIDSVKRKDIEGFMAELGQEFSKSSVASTMVRVKALFKYAVDNDYIKINPFSMVDIEKGKPKEEWLSEEEMNRIRGLEGLSPDVETARQLFLFQCASGISYSDLMKLEKGDIRVDGDTYSVTKHRAKTGVPFTSVILPEGVKILKEWNFEIPRKSNQKYNLSLLKIETKAGLSKHLHSHLGRKVYGCTLLRAEIPMKTVSRALGHSNTQITQSTYAFLQSEDIIKQISSKIG